MKTTRFKIFLLTITFICFLFSFSAEADTLFRDDFNGGIDSSWSILNEDASYYSFELTYLDLLANSGNPNGPTDDHKNAFLIDTPTSGVL